jgi:ABC-type antimicrobial peptide transport system permease subunit
MFAFYKDLVYQSIIALRDNRLRTILSVAGVAIGVAAVMTMSSIGKGGEIAIMSELETFGLRSIWIMREKNEGDPNKSVREGTGLENDDLKSIKEGCCPSVNSITPIVGDMTSSRHVRYGSRYTNASISGVNQDYFSINNDHIKDGRYFISNDVLKKNYVAVIGTNIEKEVFGNNKSAIGQKIWVGDDKLLVIGVLKEKSADFMSSLFGGGLQDANNRVLIPYTAYQKMLGTGNEIHVLQVEAKEIELSQPALEQVKSVLTRRHRDAYEYKSITMESYVDTAHKILGGISLITILAASISLFVGGMGIMNIMTTSVIERTREIGLRKAVGARRHEILTQFLVEAITISAIGGLIGLLLGMLSALVISLLMNEPITPTSAALFSGFIISVGVGLASGYYPAKRASTMLPVIALRHE